MASNKTTVEKESDDLTTCCICFEVYNEGDRQPKFLSCHHTYCLACVKKISRRQAGGVTQVTCPKCNAVCVLPVQGPEALFTNGLVLSYIQLQNRLKNHCWCLECGATPEQTCEGNHIILDRMEDVEDIEVMKAEVLSIFNEAIEKRKQIKGHLQTVLTDNGECLDKLRSLAEMKQLSARRTGTVLAKKNLEEAMKKAKEEMDEADRVWNEVNGNSSRKSNKGTIDVTEESSQAKKRKLSPAAEENPSHSDSQAFYNFPSNKISFDRLSSSSQAPLHSRDLSGQHDGKVNVLEFADDSSLFASAGFDGRVLLWPTSEAADKKLTPKPIEIVNKNGKVTRCMALNADNERLFTGNVNNHINVFDIKKKQLLNSYKLSTGVYDIALQPGKNGSVFATAGGFGILRLFDCRRRTVAASQLDKKHGDLYSVMFSPVEPAIIAVASVNEGAFIYDIRNFKSKLYSFASALGTWNARFNGSGTRLLCCERGAASQLVVYDLPTRHQATGAGKVLLMDPDFRNEEDAGCDACCFAGEEDELVISGSKDSLFFWTLPDRNKGFDCTVNRSLYRLPGTGERKTIRSVRCSNDKSFIVSCCDDDPVIKLWTSR